MLNSVQNLGLPSGDIVPFTTTQGGDYINKSFDFDSLEDYMHGSILRPHYRIFVLYEDETVHYQIPPEDLALGGSYNENYQNGQRRSLSFTLLNENGKYTPNVNTLWQNTHLQLDVGIELNDGNIIWVKKGIFVITSVKPSREVDSKQVAVQASDKFNLFEGKTGTLEMTYEIPVGSNIEQILNDILSVDGGNGYPLDSRTMIYHSSFKDKITQQKISHSAGDTYGTIIGELATQLSAEYFYNASGQLVLLPLNEASSDVDKPLLGYLTSEDGDVSSMNFDFDYSSIVNRIVVIGSSSDGAVFDATAVNDDPASPLCYQRIGFRTGPVVNDSNITSDILAQDRAKYELRQNLILKTSTSTTVVLNPMWSVNNLVAINDEFFELKSERFLLTSISFSLDYSGMMNISLSNIKNLPFMV